MKKETVGILTFHRALNYGAVLQAFATKKVCDQMGYEAHVIDYSFPGIQEDVSPVKHFLAAPNKKQAALRLIRGMMSYAGDKKREREFRAFRRAYLAESGPCASGEEILQLGCDVLLSGSDQIWNYNITGGSFDPVFFLNLDTAARKVIYAASAQDTPFPLDMEQGLAAMLRHTDAAIGIREQKLADYVSEITGLRHPLVLDPTLLAGREIMDTIPTPEPPKAPYILLYQIDSNPFSDICVRSLEARFGCKVYTMTVPRLGSTHGRRGNCGPEKFLSLLKGARFLVTNSFHGIALSLIYEKQFYVYENGSVMSRIDSLLSQVGLMGRKVKLTADIDPEFTIDYRNISPLLAALQQDSMNFLRAALAGEAPAPIPAVPETAEPLRVHLRSKKDCCGCGSCAAVCPVNAITMAADGEGFLYPKIDELRCIHCGKCDRACGFRKPQKRGNLPQAYGLKHKDLPTRQSSRSGGAFVGFSDEILRRGGVVYGAVLERDFSVRHQRAITAQERDRMKKAKYVQSDTCDIYSQVARDLKNGLELLFSGTPCQVSGLRSYLREQHVDTSKLLCCDMVCHGVPSPAIWRDYTAMIERKYGKKILEANFRNKDFGWEAHCETFTLEGRAKKIATDAYTNLFYQHICLRPSCAACPFTSVHRCGDVTLADFWGIEKHDPSFNDNRGVSLVLVNTPKGQDIFRKVSSDFEFFPCPVENCMQPTLFKPSTPSPRREQFWADYRTLPFESLIQKYTRPLDVPGRLKKAIKLAMYHTGLRKHP